jgi:hypothetical protein
VKEGDELPYIPESVGSARLSLVGGRWRVDGSVDFQSQMREVPGVDAIEDALHSDGFAVLDLSATLLADEESLCSGLAVECHRRSSNRLTSAIWSETESAPVRSGPPPLLFLRNSLWQGTHSTPF